MIRDLKSPENRALARDLVVRVIGLTWFLLGRELKQIPAIAEARHEPGTFLCFMYFFTGMLAFVGFGLMIVGQRGIETVLTPRERSAGPAPPR